MFAGPDFHGRHRPVSVMYNSTSNRKWEEDVHARKLPIFIFIMSAADCPSWSSHQTSVQQFAALCFFNVSKDHLTRAGSRKHMPPINYNCCCNSIQTLNRFKANYKINNSAITRKTLTCSAPFDEAFVKMVRLGDSLEFNLSLAG